MTSQGFSGGSRCDGPATRDYATTAFSSNLPALYLQECVLRLKDQDVEIIKNIIHAFDTEADIFVFGSRADDVRHGGDIDLLVLSKKITFDDRRKIKLRLVDQLGAQKIDLIVAEDTSKPFVKIARDEGVKL